jgi:hypothetical protein
MYLTELTKSMKAIETRGVLVGIGLIGVGSGDVYAGVVTGEAGEVGVQNTPMIVD